MMNARRTILTLLLAAAAVALAAGCAPPEQQTEAPAEVPRNVRVTTLATTDVVEYLEISGPVQPVSGAVVSAEEAGQVIDVPGDKGAAVKAGDVILRLEWDVMHAEREAARAASELADYNEEKTESLFEAGKVSRLDLLNARDAAARARAALAMTEHRYGKIVIAAPFDGLVTDRYVEVGELVSPGMSVARVVDPSVLKLVGAVTERDVADVAEGAPVTVALDGSRGEARGTVSWVGFEADPVTGKFEVEITIPNADGALRSGVVGRARIERDRHEGVLAIPRDAVVGHAGGDAVFVIEGDRAVLRPVTLGADQGLMVLLLEGARAGERLVVRGQRDLVDGALVAVTETSHAADGSADADPGVIRDAASRVRELNDGEASE